MIFTPTYDNLSERESWRNLIYNALIDDLQAKKIVGGDFDYPFEHSGSIGLNGSSLYEIGNFGSPTSSNASAIRIANGLGFFPGNTASANATAIQAIIDGLSSTGTIWLGPGTYTTDATITLNGSSGTIGNYTLKGQGIDVTTIQAAAGISANPLIRFTETPASQTATSITLRDLTIDANQLAGTGLLAYSLSKCRLINVRIVNADDSSVDGNGLDVANASECVFQNVVIEDVDGNGVFITDTNGDCERNTFTNMRIDDPGADGILCNPIGNRNRFHNVEIDSPVGDGVEFSGTGTSTHNLFSMVKVHGAGERGFDLNPPGINNRFEHCEANGCTNQGFVFEGISGGTSRQLSAVNCSAYDNGSTGFTFQHDHATGSMQSIMIVGCHSYSNGSAGFLVQGEDQSAATVLYVTMTGCAAHENFSLGISISDGVSHGIIAGNTSDLNNGNGINFVTGTNRDFMMAVTGNSCADSAAGFGIDINADVDNLIVQGNIAIGNNSGNFNDSGGSNFTTQDAADAVCNKPGF